MPAGVGVLGRGDRALVRPPSARAANEAWADACFESLRPHGTSLYSVDINPCRRAESAHDETAAAFGAALPRLQALKRAVDPDGLLRATFRLEP